MAGRINLVPAQERKRTQTDFGLVILIIAAVVVIAGLGYAYYRLSSDLSDKQAELADLQAQNQQIQAQLASLAQFDELQNQVTSTEEVVQSIYAGRTLVSDILGDISLVVPEQVWFKTLDLEAPDPPLMVDSTSSDAQSPQELEDGSLSVDGNTYTFEDVADLLVRLELIPGVEAVVLDSAGEPPLGAVNEKKQVIGWKVGGLVVNTQPPDTPLPLTQVEVDTQ